MLIFEKIRTFGLDARHFTEMPFFGSQLHSGAQLE
jgi:hypothetical protein